jgi:FemAB-related protein (PEP-CTERM system-associated)
MTVAAGPRTCTIAIAEDHDAAAWDDFVTRHPAGSFFHLFGWRRVAREALRHPTYYVLARSEQGVVGVLPLVRVKSLLFGDALTSTPLCVYGGALAQSEDIARELEQFAANMATSLGVDHLEMRNQARSRPDWPGKDLYYTFRRTLDPDPEKNLASVPRKQRAEIRAGLKNNLRVELDEGIDRFYDIYSSNLRALGTPVLSRRYFEVLRAVFGPACEITTVVHEQQPIASLMTFWFRDEVLPYYGGGLPAARPLSGYDFMYWDLMRRAAERGTRIYDFGRSKKDTGPFRYKKHWGFEPAALPYQYFLVRAKDVPNLSPTNPKYHYFIETWKRLPLPVTRLVGPMVARYLG